MICKSRFSLGKIHVMPSVEAEVRTIDILRAIEKHALGLWNDLSREDRIMNELAVQRGDDQIITVCWTTSGRELWVFTEVNRENTWITFPRRF